MKLEDEVEVVGYRVFKGSLERPFGGENRNIPVFFKYIYVYICIFLGKIKANVCLHEPAPAGGDYCTCKHLHTYHSLATG